MPWCKAKRWRTQSAFSAETALTSVQKEQSNTLLAAGAQPFRRMILQGSFVENVGGLFLYEVKHPSSALNEALIMTVVIDDAGSGDLLFGVVIGAFRDETAEFKYGLVDVKFFQSKLFRQREYSPESSRIVSELVAALKVKPEEEIHVCQGNFFDEAVVELRKVYGEGCVRRVKVTGEPQRLTEIAYLDEIRNLGYEPLAEREAKRAKSFFHMMRWLKANPAMLRYAKTGWPRLARYRLFKEPHADSLFRAVYSDCGRECEVPFKPDVGRPVYCQACWQARGAEIASRRRGQSGFH